MNQVSYYPLNNGFLIDAQNTIIIVECMTLKNLQ